MSSEGVIQFEARHRHEPLDPRRLGDAVCKLVAWREILAQLGLVGRDPARYGGYAYGNVSARVGPPSSPRHRRAFLVSGTQTSGKPRVGLEDFCVVERWEPRANAVESRGAVLPSSESLTHAAIYDLGTHLRFVFHVHCPTVWRRAAALRLPTTDPAVGYGTPEMAMEVERLYRTTPLADRRILAMGGHEDGLIVFGRDPEEAGRVLLATLAKAFEAECRLGEES